MGKLEESTKRKARKGEVQKLILESVKTVGVLSIGLITPNVLKTMARLGIISHQRQEETISSSASKLVQKGLLEFNGKYYELTKKGNRRLEQFKLFDYKFDRPARWDKKWRIVIFDIPEKKRGRRDEIRRLLTLAGFYKLQNSVWVYPHDCEDIIGLLKADLGVGKDVLYIIADEIENDKYLRQHFSL